MKVLYDNQIFYSQQFGGISRYFFELLSHFDQDKSVEWELPILYSDNAYLKTLPAMAGKLVSKSRKPDPYKTFLWNSEFRGKRHLYALKKKIFPERIQPGEQEINRSKVIEQLKKGDFDLFHPTYYDDYFLDHLGNKPFVITIYDLIHQIFPEYGMYEKTDKSKALLARATTIIAISESTKSDLVNIFNIDENKVVVTHLANSLQHNETYEHAPFTTPLPERYLLFVGGRDAYKNFLFFCYVYAALAEEEKDLCVVCTGSPFSADELFLFNKIGITGRMFHTYVDDAQLAFLYRNAEAFIFPSQYEGFGLPVLEAFSCGCPVLASNTSSLAEIGGEAVQFFEPKNPGSMLGALREIIRNRPFRQHKIDLGYRELKKYSWSGTAARTKDVYNMVLSSHAGA